MNISHARIEEVFTLSTLHLFSSLTLSQPNPLKNTPQRPLPRHLLHKPLTHRRNHRTPAIEPRLRPVKAKVMRAQELGR